MTDLAKLVVRLEAETARYQKDLERARGQLRRFDRGATESAKRVATATAAATAAAAAGFAALAKRQIDVADEAGKTAERLGLTTEELTRLRYAAKLTGAEQNTLEMSLQRMTRRLAEAATGGGEASKAIKELELDAQDLARKSPAEAFADIADRLNRVESQSQRVRLAFKFFDSEGVRLVNTLALGRKGLQEAGDEAERLGLVVDTQAARSAAEFNDNLTRLGGVATGVANQLAQRLLPDLVALSGDLVDASGKTTAMANALDSAELFLRGVGRFAVWTAEKIGSVASAAERLGEAFGEQVAGIGGRSTEYLRKEWKRLNDMILSGESEMVGGIAVPFEVLEKRRDELFAELERRQKLFGDLQKRSGDKDEPERTNIKPPPIPIDLGGGGESPYTKANREVQSLLASLNQQIATYGEGEVAVARYRALHGDLAEQFSNLGAEADPLRDRYIALTMELEDMAKEAERMNQLEAEAAQVFEATRTPLERFNDEVERLKELKRAVNEDGQPLIDEETFNRGLDQARERLNQSRDEASEWARTMEEISASAARNIQSSLAEYLYDPFSDGLDGMVENFARTVQRMLAEAAAAAVIKQMFGSAGGEGGGLEGALGGFLSSAFGGARASGGPVSTGKAYLVGENGPELMVPGTAGHIVSNEVLNQQAVNQTIVVNAPSGSVSRATELQIQAAAGRGVANAMRRNG